MTFGILLPFASATGGTTIDSDPYSPAVPPSGNYYDKLSYLVYQFNNQTGLVTPTFQMGVPEDFVCVEIYYPGGASTCGGAAFKSQPTGCAPGTQCRATCEGYTICAAVVAAVMGDHRLRAVADTTDPCWELDPSSQGNDLQHSAVSFIRAPFGITSDCASGTLDVSLFIDGSLHETQSAPYHP